MVKVNTITREEAPLVTNQSKIKVGEAVFEVFQKKVCFAPMIQELELEDPKTGQKQKVRTPHSGWSFRMVE